MDSIEDVLLSAYRVKEDIFELREKTSNCIDEVRLHLGWLSQQGRVSATAQIAAENLYNSVKELSEVRSRLYSLERNLRYFIDRAKM